MTAMDWDRRRRDTPLATRLPRLIMPLCRKKRIHRRATPKRDKVGHRIAATTAPEHLAAESVAGHWREHALLEAAVGVGGQHFCPFAVTVACGMAATEDARTTTACG